MYKIGEFIARHHVATGVVLAVAAGWSVWNAYQAGMRVQQLRCWIDSDARAASEALGG